MKSRNIIIGIATLLVLAMIAVTGWIMSNPPDIILQGMVEAKHIKVASKIPGRINKILVSVGQSVKAGDTLIIIGTPELDAKLKQAESVHNAAESQSEKAQNGAREEQIQGAYNLWQKARAAVDVYRKTYKRVKTLHSEGVVPAQKLDEVTAKYKAAQQDEHAARAMYEMAKKGAREEDKKGAAALVDQTDGVLQEIDSYLSEAQVKTPISGEVASIISQEGEIVNSGFPIATVVDLNDVWFTFNIREDYLSKVKMGKAIIVNVPALDNEEIIVKVIFINPLGDFATWKATKTTGDFDMRTFEVKARPVDKIDGLRPGMTALINWSTHQ
ncbi:MAG: efflux RND transporter periplasmic adaptor subunit [Bacteroidales bacterium]|nr:efflux RND transporter periplasmic adaptor subunit [Bacteroidales bacterium]